MFELCKNGYWIQPNGTVHPMPEYQCHSVWIFENFKDDLKLKASWGAESKATDTGWIAITFNLNMTDFAVSLYGEAVTKEAINSCKKILREHRPTDGVKINNDFDGTWRTGLVELGEYPKPYIVGELNIPDLTDDF